MFSGTALTYLYTLELIQCNQHGIMHQSFIGMATLFQAQHLDDLSLTFQGKSTSKPVLL